MYCAGSRNSLRRQLVRRYLRRDSPLGSYEQLLDNAGHQPLELSYVHFNFFGCAQSGQHTLPAARVVADGARLPVRALQRYWP